MDKTEIGLINFDNSLDDFTGGQKECNCGLMELEWSVLEMIVMGLLGLAAIVGTISPAQPSSNGAKWRCPVCSNQRYCSYKG